MSGNGQRELLDAVLGVPAARGGHDPHRPARHRAGAEPRQALRAGAVGRARGPRDRRRGARPRRPRAPRPRRRAAAHASGLAVDWKAARARRHGRERGRAPQPRAARPPGGRRCRAATSSGSCSPGRSWPTTPSSVVVAYPSRGLDIASVRATQELLLERRAAGRGVLHGLRGPRRADRCWPTASSCSTTARSPASSTRRRPIARTIGRLMLQGGEAA